MALQTSIDQYYNIRKNGPVDDINKVSNTNKVLILDKNISDTNESTSFDKEDQTKKIILSEPPKVVNNSSPKLNHRTPKSISKKYPLKQINKIGVRKYLLHYFEANSAEKNTNEFRELQAKVLNSPWVAQIKNRINRSNELLNELKEEETNSKTSLKIPSLETFDTIDIELSCPALSSIETDYKTLEKSPSPLMSTGKSDNLNIVRRKLFTETSEENAEPAYVRSSGLSSEKGLVLPHKFRRLAETFGSVDTVVSLLFNRNETIYFSKLKDSVELMTKRNLTQSHLGQIHSLCPDMFSFKQEKLKHIPGQADKYELVVTPMFELNNDESINSNEKGEKTFLMTPSVLFDRKRKLYSALLEKTKDYHEEFISTLSHSFVFNRSLLTRWHPEFNLDRVPDVQAALLPQPPNVEKCSSAKDVLSKARALFIFNARMERALEKVSTNNKESSKSPASSLASSLKGIPKSLLERVRAKQAAKRLNILTRDPEETKLRTEYSRLPEIARIVSNIFISEKKNVLPMKLVLSKLSNSYREILSPSSMERHLTLLINCSSGWLSTVHYKKNTFYKIVKDTELSIVLQNIQEATDLLE